MRVDIALARQPGRLADVTQGSAGRSIVMIRFFTPLLVLAMCSASSAQTAAVPANELLDYDGFAKNVAEVRALRESRRVSEAEFMRMAREPGTVVLDARSERLYRLRHVAGAVNLSFPEFTQDTLARAIPTLDSRILIYCNNNFTGAPESLPVKAVSSALNLSTFVSLHAYGYRNVYELGPLIDVARSKLAFAGLETR
jgi:Rhodanese-like domain